LTADTGPRERTERRLLILSPFGRDGELLRESMRRFGVACDLCADLAELRKELELGAAAILLAEEALAKGAEGLAEAIDRQPPWSDLPVLLLTRRGADSAAVALAIGRLGNVTLLERPVRVGALGSAVRSALRGRERQYQTRAHLREREEADRRKDEFLATLAHELRNPLAPIRNSVGVLRMSAGAGPIDQLSSMMERQIGHMVQLVDDLLEVSRISRGKIDLRLGEVALASVLEAAIESSRPLIESQRHLLSVALPEEPLPLRADATRLTQVFTNLLNNAAKFTEPGGRIEVRAQRLDGDMVLVGVADTGLGISAESLPRVFDMFMQIPRLQGRAESGLGIGLTLARNLVEMHGGSIAAESEGVGKGSRFTVRLPLDRRRTARATAPARAASSALRGLPRVLVVDDNRDAADSLGALLQMLGADARVAYDGLSALEAAASFRPDAVFLDIGMPDMGGTEVARQLRLRPEGRTARLIALTGWGQQHDRRLTREAGFDHHLVKPAELASLQAVLADLPGASLPTRAA
jgi:signal transduction histidine kinase/CheY-like chemotaxis protein